MPFFSLPIEDDVTSTANKLMKVINFTLQNIIHSIYLMNWLEAFEQIAWVFSKSEIKCDFIIKTERTKNNQEKWRFTANIQFIFKSHAVIRIKRNEEARYLTSIVTAQCAPPCRLQFLGNFPHFFFINFMFMKLFFCSFNNIVF